MRRFALMLLIPLIAACSRPTVPAVPSLPPAVIPTGAVVDIQPTPEITSQPQTEPTASDPTAEPFIPTLTQLTQPGCCVQPFWSPDGQMVMFIDRPQPTAQTGIYGVPITGGEPQLVTDRIGLPSPDGRYRAYLNEQGQTVVEPFNSEVQWTIPNGGLRVFFSPDSERLAWAETPRSGNFDERPTTISVADIDGSDPSALVTVYGGGIAGWLDDDHLLVVGRERARTQDIALFSVNVIDDTRATLTINQRIRSTQISPGGQWVHYMIAMHPEDSQQDGLWIVNRDGTTRYKVQVVGGARWRDESHLLIIPLDMDVESHRLWEFDATTGEAYPLTDPAVTPFRVAQGDWSVSPTGNHIVFLGQDQSLWLMTLPPRGQP